jgi:hypothetical protein
MSQNTVILGSGIIGLSTAYYLSQSLQPSTIHLIEPSPTLFASASGYAGGFLARDWFAAACAELGELSFEEHRKLAEEYNGGEKWGWGWSTSFSYVASRKGSANGKAARGDDWLRGDGSRAVESNGVSRNLGADEDGAVSRPRWLKTAGGDTLEVISGDKTTAQVYAFLLQISYTIIFSRIVNTIVVTRLGSANSSLRLVSHEACSSITLLKGFPYIKICAMKSPVSAF